MEMRSTKLQGRTGYKFRVMSGKLVKMKDNGMNPSHGDLLKTEKTRLMK